MAKIKPLTLEIDDELWTKFKGVIPRTITLNDAIINLISERVKSKAKRGNKNEVARA